MTQLIKGKIISYLENKYGFIDAKDGFSYYFDKKSFQDSNQQQPIKIGLDVIFKPLATRKGMSAINIRLGTSFSYKYMPYFSFVKYGNKTNGNIELAIDIVTPYFNTGEEAKNYLFSLAKKTGSNAILDARIYKEKKQNLMVIYIMSIDTTLKLQLFLLIVTVTVKMMQ